MVRVRVKPILFNIYINSYVSELECFARMKASEPGGVLYELYANIHRLQWLVDTLSTLLRLIGLIVNIRRTKL